MSRCRVNSSPMNGTAATSDVVLSIEMTSLPVGGMITRIACGSTTRVIVCHQPRPERGRGLVLPLVDREQSSAHDLGHVGRLVQGEADDREREVREEVLRGEGDDGLRERNADA